MAQSTRRQRSDTISSSDELSCLTANLISVFQVRVDLTQMDKSLEGPCEEVDAGQPWTKVDETGKKWMKLGRPGQKVDELGKSG